MIQQRERTESSDSITELVKEKASKGARLLIKTYLWIYNMLALLGWILIFLMLFVLMLLRTPLSDLNHLLIVPLLIVQTLAILEPVHALLGVTNNRYLPVLMQVSSRLWMTWMIVLWCKTGAHLCFPLMLMAWSLADITRLMFYVCKELRIESKAWRWICAELEAARYNWFICLYPVGAISEWILMYRAWATFSSVSTFFHLLFISLLIIWPLGFAFMYSHMLNQRSKRIN